MKKRLAFLLFSCALVIGVFALFSPVSSAQFRLQKSLRVFSFRPFIHGCGLPGMGQARCHIQVVTDNKGKPLASPIPPTGAYGPSQFHSAYNLPCTPGGQVAAVCGSPASFSGTIAIVDAYQDPTVENDLNVYSSAFGIPSCTVQNGCLQIIDQHGGNNLPSVDSGWALETSLDVQIAHSMCQTCKILLVETNSSSITDLGTGVNTAAAFGAQAISNSYGAKEFLGETNYDNYYNHPGVAITVSSGDSGYGTEYPASAPTTVAVGGTTLQLFTDNTYASESVWSGTGSGCSHYENANSWQTGLSNWGQTGCSTKRGVTDIAADADPSTGAAVYDSTPYSGQTGWWTVGGTSLSSPLIASVYVLAGGVAANTQAASLLYSNFPSNAFHDIVSGSNGSCSTSMCLGVSGYDGPTGLGSPDGVLGFTQNTVTPTPTATPTPTLTPTPTPTPIVDTTAPTVNITQPANNALVKHATRVQIVAQASDNVGVTRVEIYINGNRVATRTISPYTYNWFVPNTRNRIYTLTAKAYDAAGNSATSSITVTSF